MSAQELAIIPADSAELEASALTEAISYQPITPDKLDQLDAESELPAYVPGLSADDAMKKVKASGQRCVLSALQMGRYLKEQANLIGWGGVQQIAKDEGISRHIVRRLVNAYEATIAMPISNCAALRNFSPTSLSLLKDVKPEGWAQLNAGNTLAGKTLEELPKMSSREIDHWVTSQKDPQLKKAKQEIAEKDDRIHQLEKQHDKDQNQIAELIAKAEAEEIDRTPEVVKQTTREAMAIAAAHCQLCVELKDNLLYLRQSFAMSRTDDRKQNLRDALRPIAKSIGIAFEALAEINQFATDEFGELLPQSAEDANHFYVSRGQAKESMDQMLGKITSCLDPVDRLVFQQKLQNLDGRHTMTKVERKEYITAFEQSKKRL